MSYTASLISSLFSTVFIIFAIMVVGYLVGRITIKGVSLGTAGVLLVALVYGVLASFVPYFTVGDKTIVLYLAESVTLENGTVLSATSGLFSLVSNIGTALFVTAVGLIAGPKFFRMFNRKSLSYILMGVVIIAIGTVVSVCIIQFSNDPNVDSSLVIGLMTGALTSTPGFSAAKEVAADSAKVAAGYGIAYLYGVIGVVLFVQLLPRLLKVDIEKERNEFVAANAIEVKPLTRKLVKVDAYEFFPFGITIIFGCLIGAVKIPGIGFSLGTSGGVLVAGLIIGHFGHIGPFDCRISKSTLNFLRELGLVFFLIGAGVPGGVNFISNVKPSYFLYGIIITTVPMIVGYILAKYVFRLSIFNALGSITGGMTSTPALGALISTAGTEDVSSSYAASYPFALFCIVLAARIVAGVM
ncbi:MAG: permease [Clostridiales bacterium]|nr:permease [Clostridiales bacterium]